MTLPAHVASSAQESAVGGAGGSQYSVQLQILYASPTGPPGDACPHLQSESDLHSPRVQVTFWTVVP